MAVVWNPLALVGFLMLLLTWLAAALVFLPRPDRAQNRALAAFLFTNGIWGFVFFGIRLLFDGDDARGVVGALGPVGFIAWSLMLFAYLAFIATIPSPLTRPLRRPWLWLVVGPAFVVWTASVFFARSLWFTGLLPWRHSPGWQYDVGPMVLIVIPVLAVAISLFGIAVAFSALREARTSLVRKQMQWYAAAFITYDVLFVAFNLLLRFSINEHTTGFFWERFYFVLAMVPTTAAVVLLTYGILMARLFDIDLRIKWAIRRGAVVSVFVGGFLVAFAVAEQFLQERFGWLVGGLFVGILLILFRPIERMAGRFADAAMPGVRDSAQYRTVKKREVYRATVEGAFQDGVISERERDMLARLQDQLALTATEAREIEREVTAGASN